MWLLTTSRAELQYFPSPKDVPQPGFAILSHTWGKEEQSFQDLQRIHKQCKESGDNPRGRVSERIRRCCELAEADGYGWAWADRQDEQRRAHRGDQLHVPILPALRRVLRLPRRRGLSSPVRSAVTHNRSTRRVQMADERLDAARAHAPTFAVFLSSSWTPLGSKADLAKELSIATKIPEELLQLDLELNDFSIAQRMSWAAKRVTTREEDEAYCLLGIFNIHMPTLYGEGRNAFQRLQEEIMRTSPDTTLFAWGLTYNHPRPPTFEVILDPKDSPLFARAPRDFLVSGEIVYNHDSSPDNRASLIMTSHGVRARAPLATVRGFELMNLFWHDGARSVPLFLMIIHHPNHDNLSSPNSTHPYPTLSHAETKYGSDWQYFISGRNLRLSPMTIKRLVACNPEVLREAEWQMADIYLPVLADHSRSADNILNQNLRSCILFNRSLAVPFHIHAPHQGGLYVMKLSAANRVGLGNVSPIYVYLESPTRDSGGFKAHILLGVCTQGGSASAPRSGTDKVTRCNTVHWARAYRKDSRVFSHRNLDNYHICSEDHIYDWPNYTKIVIPESLAMWKDSVGYQYTGDGNLSLRFTRSPYNPDIMVLQEILLSGRT